MPKRQSAPDTKLREAVYSQQNGICWWCGFRLPSGIQEWAFHHRKLKSRGGLNEACNGIALHHRCHNIYPESVHQNPKLATDRGFMVSTWANPSACPVTLVNGDTVTLTC